MLEYRRRRGMVSSTRYVGVKYLPNLPPVTHIVPILYVRYRVHVCISSVVSLVSIVWFMCYRLHGFYSIECMVCDKDMFASEHYHI